MILLKLDGIDGDSNIPGYEKWIACTSVSWNVERTFSESAKSGTQDVNLGTAEIPPISLNKSFDAASVYMMQSAVGGGALGSEAKIHFLATGGQKANLYLEFKLYNPIMASWSISGDEDERPTEEVSLWYWKIWMQYYTTKDGKAYGEWAKGARAFGKVGRAAGFGWLSRNTLEPIWRAQPIESAQTRVVSRVRTPILGGVRHQGRCHVRTSSWL
jgi:type VI secretion system secreted protein Hcp